MYVDQFGNIAYLRCDLQSPGCGPTNDAVLLNNEYTLNNIEFMHVVAAGDGTGTPWVAFTGTEVDDSEHLYVVRCTDNNGNVGLNCVFVG